MRRSFEVDVNPSIIKWARESAGWSVEKIASKLKTSIENYKYKSRTENSPQIKSTTSKTTEK